MKKESKARIILIISIIILLSTDLMTARMGSLFPIFISVVALSIVPIAIGSRNQKILAFIVLFISVSLAILAFQGLRYEKHERERIKKLFEEKQRAFEKNRGQVSTFDIWKSIS